LLSKRTEPQPQESFIKKLGEVRIRGFRDMKADRHTDRQTCTDRNLQIANLQCFTFLPGTK